MAKRFFKLLYIFALMGVALWLPTYILLSIDYEGVVRTSYKARCLTNNEYVVLQGSPENLAYIFDEVSYNDTTFGNLKKDLNFYCKYHDEIQTHIVAYNQAHTREAQVNANQEFFAFEQSVIETVFSYPMLYELEVVENELQPYKIYSPIIDGIVGALIAFILLQIARMSYVYVVFGKVIWHPFRRIGDT